MLRMMSPDADDAEFIPLPAAGRAGAARAGQVVSGPITQGGHLTLTDVRGEQSRWSLQDLPIDADMVKATEANTVLGRLGETSDIAALVAHLAFDEGR